VALHHFCRNGVKGQARKAGNGQKSHPVAVSSSDFEVFYDERAPNFRGFCFLFDFENRKQIGANENFC
jgi:hypothetical protein